MAEMLLEVTDYQGPTRWRWVLTEPGGRFVDDHDVRLNESEWQYEAFRDLRGYVALHAAPDQRLADEARIVADVGRWAGDRVLGRLGPALMAARPVTVRVVVPEQAGEVMFCPLELAHAGGRPIAVQGVTLVMQPGGQAVRPAAPVGERLRVLGLFSLPDGERPLNSRRERHALVQLFAEIGAAGRAVDLRVLQYGVTRDRLKDVLREAEGWDIVHISGHGAPGELLLETEAGLRDPIGAAELAGLLDVARERLKLVSVSACWSAALTAGEQRRLLALPPVPGRTESGPDPRRGRPVVTLATELAARLGCAVLAMRFPVTDAFAIGLTESLYDLLVGKGQPLARALGIALTGTVADPATSQCPASSAATPALFGGSAASLRLEAPRRGGPQPFDPWRLRLAGFDRPQPRRFVGRVAVMAAAGAALAPRSGVSGIWLHGMPGGGKTSCALELAYTHEEAFEYLIWHQAPPEGSDTAGALADFARGLGRKIEGLNLAQVIDDDERLRGALPALTEFMRRTRVLIVVDNAESLLTGTGRWRDHRWGLVIAALTGHGGFGRLVVTSRRRPESLDPRVRLETVGPLSLDEALLLARELPDLAALIDTGLPGLSHDDARALALRVLEVSQGHPKLLELADKAAGSPVRLHALLRAAGQAWQERGGLPEGFFAAGGPDAADEDYLHVLRAWTAAAAAGLTPGHRDLFAFLCLLEENDRVRFVLESTWPRVWERLGRPGLPAALGPALAALAACGLVATGPGDADSAAGPFDVHPAVAAAGRDMAGKEFRAAADTDLGMFWAAAAHDAQGGDHSSELYSDVVVRAGLSAAPYLIRQGSWPETCALMERALLRDASREVAGMALPVLRRIVGEAENDEVRLAASIVLAEALAVTDPAEAERQMRAVLDDALARGDYAGAAIAAGHLFRACIQSGRLAEAHRIAGDAVGYVERAGLGPVDRIAAEMQVLQVLACVGQGEHVLAETERLRRQLEAVPDTSAEQRAGTYRWDIREELLVTGFDAARRLGRWDTALQLNAEVIALKAARHAAETDIARSRFFSSGPLVRLGRYDEALAVLRDCRDAFERAHDTQMLGSVLGALADAEEQRGHGVVAAGLAREALRYSYIAGNVSNIAHAHDNLGSILAGHGDDTRMALTHHLAAALIRAAAGGVDLNSSVWMASFDLDELDDAAALPADLRELSSLVSDVPGADLAGLLAGRAADRQALEQVLDHVIIQVRALAENPLDYLARTAMWSPFVAGLLAAGQGDTAAAECLDECLAEMAGADDCTALAGVLSQIRHGHRSPGLAGLGLVDAAIARHALDALTGQVDVPVELWPAMLFASLLGCLVAAAAGDEASAAEAREMLATLAGMRGCAPLAAVLTRILDGDRDLLAAGELADPTVAAVTAVLLRQLEHFPRVR